MEVQGGMERPWWLRLYGLPPGWQVSRVEAANLPLSAARSAGTRRVLILGTVFNALISVLFLVICPIVGLHEGRHGRELLALWLVFLVFLTLNLRRSLRRLQRMLNGSPAGPMAS